MRSTTRQIIRDVFDERHRQHDKWGKQSHPDGTGNGFNNYAEVARARCDAAAANNLVTWQHILNEEVFEAFAENDPAKLRAELIQVIGVIVQWIEDIDERQADAM